ncbi:hypothetical protein Tco_0699485 [Tanacetum coccineum]
METQKPLLKDEDGKEVDVHLYRSMIGSLMYLTSSRPDIIFVVCACARYQVNPKVSHLHAVKRIFRYLKASLDRKSTTGGCQFLGCRLISWQCKKQTVVANSITKAEYVAALSCCGQSGEHIEPIVDEVVLKERGDSLVRAATTASSLEAEHASGNINKTRFKVTLNEPNPHGTGSGSGPRSQDTMGDTIDQTRFENMSNTSNDSLLARVNTPRSDEDSMKLKELMEFCTKLQQRVLDLENTKTAQAQEITSLKLRVKKLEKKGGSRTHKLKRLYKVGRSARMVSSDEASLGDQEDASKQRRKIDDIDKDAEITLVDET